MHFFPWIQSDMFGAERQNWMSRSSIHDASNDVDESVREGNTMKSKSALKCLIGSVAVGGALALTGCASLHDAGASGAKSTAAPTPPGRVGHSTTLSADALFRFDGAGLGDMLPMGKAELDRLAWSLRSRELNVRGLNITGHTDRLGDAAYNDGLSLRRANTVRAYLKGAGVALPMQARGMGERQPVSGARCPGSQPSRALIACLQPDRRVVVDFEEWAAN